MARHRVTIGLVHWIFGASETYYTAEGTEADLGDRVQALIDARKATLWSSVKFTGVRISEIDAGTGRNTGLRRSMFYPPGSYTVAGSGIKLTVPSQGTLPGPVDSAYPDQARASLQVMVRYDVNRTVMRYFAFPPDDVLQGEPTSFTPNGNTTWSAKFQTLVEELTSGRWSIRARQSTVLQPARPILRWVEQAGPTGNIGVVVSSIPAPGFEAGDEVQIRAARRKGTDRTSYNGHYFAESVVASETENEVTVYLRQTSEGDPNSVKIAGTIQLVKWGYYPIQNFVGWRAGTRKRGAPLGLPRGRRSVRAKLDP